MVSSSYPIKTKHSYKNQIIASIFVEGHQQFASGVIRLLQETEFKQYQMIISYLFNKAGQGYCSYIKRMKEMNTQASF